MSAKIIDWLTLKEWVGLLCFFSFLIMMLLVGIKDKLETLIFYLKKILETK